MPRPVLDAGPPPGRGRSSWRGLNHLGEARCEYTEIVESHVLEELDELAAAQLARPKFNAVMLNWLAGLAVLLAALGIFSVTAYAVAQRTNELGLRLALGAQKIYIMRLVLKQGLKLTIFGLAVGIVTAVIVTRWLRSLLYAVSATDPLTFVLIALLPLVIATLACWIPARRATKVDPLVALRYE